MTLTVKAAVNAFIGCFSAGRVVKRLLTSVLDDLIKRFILLSSQRQTAENLSLQTIYDNTHQFTNFSHFARK